jgi:hypothetical protein
MSTKIVQGLYTLKCQIQSYKVIHNKMSNEIAQGLSTIKCQIKSYKAYTQYNVK